MHWKEVRRLRLREEKEKRTRPKRAPVDLPEYGINLFRPARYKVIYGGRGGARSWSVARALLVKAAEKKIRVLCAREMQSSIKDSVHQLLRDQIDLMGLKGFIVTDREIRHANGSLFIFKGIRHNITAIKSLEAVDIAWVEEAERISSRSWQVLIPTIRKEGSEIWVTFNPDQEEDATYQRFVVNTPKNTYIQQVNWEDNPWLTPELRAEKDYAYETDPEAAEHVWGGKLRQISEAQIMRDKWIVQEFTVPRDELGDPLWNGPYQGEDFGFGSDPAAAIRCWTHDQYLYIEHEMYQHKLELDHTADALEEAIPGFSDYVTRADSSRPDSISFLRRHGVPRIVGVEKGPGSVEDGIAHIRSYRKVIIHSRCIHTKNEFKLYSYKVDENSGDVLPIVVDKHNHCIDSIRYALQPMIKPRQKAGFIFSGIRDAVMVCPVCSSRVPDDGECPHCGAFVDMTTGKLIDATDHDPVIETPMVSTRKHEHTNGNGSHHNGNGHAPESPSTEATPRRFSMRGLNG